MSQESSRRRSPKVRSSLLSNKTLYQEVHTCLFYYGDEIHIGLHQSSNVSSSIIHSGVRTWCGDVMDLPNFLGPADAFFFNGVFGNLHSPRDALLKAALLMRPGGSVVVSHPMGRAWHSRLHAEDPAHVPHPLPQSREAFDQIIHDLPLRLVDFVDEPDCYLAHLQV